MEIKSFLWNYLHFSDFLSLGTEYLLLLVFLFCVPFSSSFLLCNVDSDLEWLESGLFLHTSEFASFFLWRRWLKSSVIPSILLYFFLFIHSFHVVEFPSYTQLLGGESVTFLLCVPDIRSFMLFFSVPGVFPLASSRLLYVVSDLQWFDFGVFLLSSEYTSFFFLRRF